MDSLLNPPVSEQRNESDVVPLKEAPTAEEIQSGGLPRDLDGQRDATTKSPTNVGVAAEQPDSAPADQASAQRVPQPAAAISPELVQQLEATARDLAACIKLAQHGSNFSARLPATEPILIAEQPTTRDPDRSCVAITSSSAGADLATEQLATREFAQDATDPQPGPVTHAAPDAASQRRFKNDKLSKRRRAPRFLARLVLVALIGAGAAFAWQYKGDEAKKVLSTWGTLPPGWWLFNSAENWIPDAIGDKATKMIGTWAASIGWLPPLSTTKSPTGSFGRLSSKGEAPAQPAPVTTVASPDLVQQVKAMARDLAATRNSIKQLTAKQEQMADNIATLRADSRQRISSPSPSLMQTTSALAAASPELMQQVKVLADDITATRNGLNQLAAKQEQMAERIATVQAAEENITHKISPLLTQLVPLPHPHPARSSFVPRQPPPRPSLPILHSDR